jgi:hypothetical protein
MAFWIVRAGSTGKEEDAALVNNFVTIGWNELTDLSSISDKTSLRKLWLRTYKNQKKGETANMMGQVWNFLGQIKIGDLVALPLKKRPSVVVGEILGDYEYKQITQDINHIRLVRWFGEIPKSEFDQDLIKSLGTYMTVFRIRKPNAEKRVRRMLNAREIKTPISITDAKQQNTTHSDISASDIPEILNEFRKWISGAEGQNHMRSLRQEISEVRTTLQRVQIMDKNSSEFVDWILYGLLPHSESKNAKRTSMFPAFWNIKALFLANYDYKEDNDWRTIANLVYDLVTKFKRSPHQLSDWIQEFISDKVHSRGLQCGAISPILFCINSTFPIVNNRVVHTYNDFANALSWNDTMSPKLDEYIKNIDKCNKLINTLGASEFTDLGLFDTFCYWYDNFYLLEEEEEDNVSNELAEKIKLADVNFVEFFNKVNLEEFMNFESHALKNPERATINEIIKESSMGRWVLPKFQRYFDWKKDDVKEFLQSVFYDYYVGSLLFWEVGNNLPVETMPIKGAEVRGEASPRFIILDGQQRITSLYYAIQTPDYHLKGTKMPFYFYINFSRHFSGEYNDEIIEVLPRKLSDEESFTKMLFPLYRLGDCGTWVYDFEDFISKKVPNFYPKVRKARSIMERKLRHIQEGFEIPYITLPSSMEIHHVTSIFERINTMGIMLNAFDLLIARLSIYKINLRLLWEKTISEFPDIKRYDDSIGKLPIYIIQAISLCYNKASSTKREDILNIYQRVFEDSNILFEDKWHEMSEYANSAINMLENLRFGLGVKDEKEVPFTSMIPILAALLREIGSRENKMDCNKKLKMWYWSAIFSNAYSSAVESQLTSDFKELREWFSDDNKIPKTVESARREIVTINLRQSHAQSSAIYRGVLSLLALKGARDFDTSQTLEFARSNDKDHIFPKSGFAFEKEINSIVNITWNSDETNRKIKGYKLPSQFCKIFLNEKFSGNQKEFQEMLESHFINSSAYDSMLNDDFKGFMAKREEILLSEIYQSIGIKDEVEKPTLISPGKPFTNTLIMRETIRGCREYIHWIDKYFSNEGLELLSVSIDKDKIKSIKILTSIPNTTFRLKKSFERFKEEMSNDKIASELRVIINQAIASKIHDRWILSKNANFNIPSPDVVARGQYSEVKKTNSEIPFNELWENGLDITNHWLKIDEAIREFNNRRIRY